MRNSKILLVDNYDSFTYNLVNILRKSNKHSLEVQLNDRIDLEKVAAFDRIIFSPGPDVPQEGDMMWQILDGYKDSKSILGICLGFQTIGKYFGATLFNLEKVFHGQTKQIKILDPTEKFFAGISSPFTGGLYHSWGVSKQMFPENLVITAESINGRMMALRHKDFDIRGVQFHPESIMTPEGEKMIKNWLEG